MGLGAADSLRLAREPAAALPAAVRRAPPPGVKAQWAGPYGEGQGRAGGARPGGGARAARAGLAVATAAAAAAWRGVSRRWGMGSVSSGRRPRSRPRRL